LQSQPKETTNYTSTEGKEKVLDDELECKICYQRFTVHSRKPKILDCLHRLCARCLTKILHIGVGSPCVSCPFCHHETELHEDEVEGLPDDTNIMSKLMLKHKTAWNSDCKVVLTPENLASSCSSHGSNCLVITIIEVQRDSPRTPTQSTLCKYVHRILVWLLGFLYFGSVPLGIYLLVIQKVTLGGVCVSFVPSSLTVCLMYGFCQYLCHGICDCSSQS
uniref:E3 ubiquitin-protein ligase RNF182 n=1 Tax=Aquila chrysaetos chrysaetos TaxID=223781 RepID=A0A663DQA9_AQUCH